MVLDLGGVVRRAESLRLYNAARSIADGLIPHNGSIRAGDCYSGPTLPQEHGTGFRDLCARVLIFAGMTARDTQRINEMYSVMDDGSAAGRKAVMGALQLYLDFINLFLFLLRFLGDRRE